MKALIAGAGIGGLAAGLALAQDGWDVELFEQAPELAEVGAGIQISPNGMKVLDALGITPAIEDTLFEPETIQLRHAPTGREIFTIPMKGYAEQRWGRRFIQIHRADLHDALRAALEALPNTSLKIGAKVTGYMREHEGVAAYLEGGDRVSGDLLVGADGIHSAIRAQMLGPEHPRFTGNVAWRMTVPINILRDDVPPMGACVWAGPGKHAVTTRISGGEVANFVGIVEQTGWTEEGWKVPGDKAQALKDFGDWDPVLRRIIELSSQPYRWALFDRPALKTWCDGPVALLGDAAHPMLPSMAQGAVQALEDAVALAKALREHPDAATATGVYETARKTRASAIQARSKANLQMFHKRTLAAQLATYGPIWAAGRASPDLLHGRQDWIYGHDPLT